MQYNAEYKTCHHTALSILKEFGFGKRLMEYRIQIEVGDFICKVKGQNGRPFNPDLMIMSSVMNIIHSILFGTRLEYGGPKIDQIIDVIHRLAASFLPELVSFPQLRYIPYYRRKWNAAIAVFIELSLYVGTAIDESRSDKNLECFVNSYLEIDPDRMKLNTHLSNLLTAGAETSTMTLRWCLIILANHPDVQARLQKEIDAVVPRGERLPSLDDRSRLPYVEAALLEVMRFKTLAPLCIPHMTLCDTIIEDRVILANTLVSVLFSY